MSIFCNLAAVREQVARAADRAHRDPSTIQLMAVSKTHPAAAIAEAYAAGHRLFGENRVQEMHQKAADLAHLPDLAMHLIGPLQNNKTARAAEFFASVDTVDSLKTAQRLDSSAAALNKHLSLLIEVKLSPEDSKHGVQPEALGEFLAGIAELNYVELRGLLTVPPAADDPEAARPYFRQLRDLRDLHQQAHPTLTELSMGMSHDFAVAIDEGSTTVRIGTAIFGQRGTPLA